MALDDWLHWLEATDVATAVRENEVLFPWIESVHVLAIVLVIGTISIVDLRLLGAYGADQPGRRVAKRFLPLVWWPILILLATGLIMIVGEPGRSLKNPAFQLKMALLAGALIVTVLCQRRLRRAPGAGPAGTGGLARSLAILSLLLWAGIIFAGRWIAYS